MIKIGATDTDDPEDSEYNFMAEDQKEEKEEYRTDRAVKISRKLCLVYYIARIFSYKQRELLTRVLIPTFLLLYTRFHIFSSKILSIRETVLSMHLHLF